MEEPGVGDEYVVGWRRDRRYSRAFTRLSVYGDRQVAISKALTLSNGYVPTASPAKNRPRDTQRSSVYRWERELTPSRQLSFSEMVSEADCLCRRLGVEAVPLSIGPERLAGYSYFVPSKGIVIARVMMDTATLRHELAHYIVWRMGIEEPSHGPAFAATLVAVHAFLGNCRSWTAVKSAQAAGIQINEPLLEGLLSFWAERENLKAA